MPVHLQIVEDAVDVARASQHICAQVRERSDAVLGLATGSTPGGLCGVGQCIGACVSHACAASTSMNAAVWMEH